MTTASRTIQSSSTTAISRFAQLGMAAILGAFIVGAAGFANIDAVHNAGHDYRHSMGFPCH
ncbi:MAG: CbtB-domain containing protein [Rhizobiaceae bacterium]